EHGKCKADIAVINGHLEGFEIKSGADTLSRLSQQIISYNAVFDYSSIVLEERHLSEAIQMVPKWWGIILATENNDELQFKTLRPPSENTNINNYAVAQLLWRKEAQEILFNLGIRGTQLRQKRSLLYSYIVEMIDCYELRHIVREYLKKRQYWRHLEQPILNDGLYPPNAMLSDFL
ncbi:MAG: sce7726 family protein, partial [Anaerolineaceae bacterium]